ncbi:hypothetical protein B0H14DRAFT_2637474 [Mycena olivaceomarginata]|nr:hypothetical protein B0H14DRAFT_2637474 [Mycena olivaceomarginata]
MMVLPPAANTSQVLRRKADARKRLQQHSCVPTRGLQMPPSEAEDGALVTEAPYRSNVLERRVSGSTTGIGLVHAPITPCPPHPIATARASDAPKAMHAESLHYAGPNISTPDFSSHATAVECGGQEDSLKQVKSATYPQGNVSLTARIVDTRASTAIRSAKIRALESSGVPGIRLRSRLREHAAKAVEVTSASPVRAETFVEPGTPSVHSSTSHQRVLELDEGARTLERAANAAGAPAPAVTSLPPFCVPIHAVVRATDIGECSASVLGVRVQNEAVEQCTTATRNHTALRTTVGTGNDARELKEIQDQSAKWLVEARVDLLPTDSPSSALQSPVPALVFDGFTVEDGGREECPQIFPSAGITSDSGGLEESSRIEYDGQTAHVEVCTSVLVKSTHGDHRDTSSPANPMSLQPRHVREPARSGQVSALVRHFEMMVLGVQEDSASPNQRRVLAQPSKELTVQKCDVTSSILEPRLSAPESVVDPLVIDGFAVELGGPDVLLRKNTQLDMTTGVRTLEIHTRSVEAPRPEDASSPFHGSPIPLPPPSDFLSASTSGIFVLVSTIIRTCRISHLGYPLGGERAPYMAWAREGIGTHSWN